LLLALRRLHLEVGGENVLALRNQSAKVVAVSFNRHLNATLLNCSGPPTILTLVHTGGFQDLAAKPGIWWLPFALTPAGTWRYPTAPRIGCLFSEFSGFSPMLMDQ
jgi:hypothetical protein